MSNYTPSRLGQVNGSGNTDALFLNVFAGEVMTAFDVSNVMLARNTVRTIPNGRSAQFPASGLADAYDHTPGVRLTGRAISHAERIITIDGLLVSDVSIASIDEAMNHYDVRSIYTVEVGRALSRRMDRNLLQIGCLAARATTTIDGLPGGTQVNGGANLPTNTSGALRDSLFTASQTLDEKNVPEEGRFCVIRPAQYYRLVLDAVVPNRDYSGAPGADVRTGKVWEVSGIEIVKSNNLPSTNITTGNTKYQGNFTNTFGLVMHPAAVGTLKLLDLQVEGAYQVETQATLIVAKYLAGHGILRPECAVELRNA
jgi:hypothetical protein